MPGAFNFVDPRLAAVMAPMRLSRPSSRLEVVVPKPWHDLPADVFLTRRIYQGRCRREHHAAIKMIVLVVGDHPNGCRHAKFQCGVWLKTARRSSGRRAARTNRKSHQHGAVLRRRGTPPLHHRKRRVFAFAHKAALQTERQIPAQGLDDIFHKPAYRHYLRPSARSAGQRVLCVVF